MASAMRRIGSFLGLSDEIEVEEVTEAPTWAKSDVRVRENRTSLTTVNSVSATSTANALNQIFTVNPRSYSEARVIGERYREGNTVLMNLSDMSDEERKRIVDFASGLVFGHHGTIERVTPAVFLLSPANVTISADVKSSAAEASFFNQS
jgi:cell division inhibitor SepF